MLDAKLLPLLAAGFSKRAAARHAGVARSVVTRRLEDPAFRARLGDLCREQFTWAKMHLTCVTARATRTLCRLMRTTYPPPVQLGAAKTLLEMAFRVVEVEDLRREVEALKARLEGGA